MTGAKKVEFLATKVMGWETNLVETFDGCKAYWTEGFNTMLESIISKDQWNPLSSLSDAWMVLGKYLDRLNEIPEENRLNASICAAMMLLSEQDAARLLSTKIIESFTAIEATGGKDEEAGDS